MSNLFLLLLLVSLMALVCGIIKPGIVIRWGARRTRGQVLLVYGLLAICSFVLFGVTVQNEPAVKPTTQTLNYETLREWKPNDNPSGLGLEILVKPDVTKDEIVGLVTGLGRDKDPVFIGIYTSRQAFDEAQKNQYGDEFKKNFICTFVKNGTGTGAFAGFNEIRWMQSVGTFSELSGKSTPL